MIDKEIGIKCTGCSACYNVCPKKCITMEENEEGFLYPKVNEKECIKCNLCVKKCPVLNKEKNENIIEKIYAAYSKDDKNRKNSSSGGCFGELSKIILNNGGVVFGASYDEDFNVVHSYVENLADLEKLKGSKYIQSNVLDNFYKAKSFLEEGRLVLFSGTPCQIAGLKKFLGKEYENLYLLSIVCHGVPSKKVFQKYLQKYKKNGKIDNFNFRDKKISWENYSLKIDFKNGKENTVLAKKDSYMRTFLSNICLRESCYDCEFKDEYDRADVTIGDFWGIDNIMPEMNDHKGISILITRTQKGEELIEKCKEGLIIKEGLPKNILVKYNPCIQQSVKRPKQRDEFFSKLEKTEFDELVDKEIPKDNILKKILKGILKRIFVLIKR